MDIKELDLAVLTDKEILKLQKALYAESDARYVEKNRKRKERDEALKASPEWQENESAFLQYQKKREELMQRADQLAVVGDMDPNDLGPDPDYDD